MNALEQRLRFGEALAEEVARCEQRIAAIDGIMKGIKPGENDESLERLSKRRAEWETYQAQLKSAASHRPSLNLIWGGMVEV